jgi:hypothetical protein
MSEWIMCGERLPPNNTEVFISNGTWVSNGYREGIKYYFDEDHPASHVTHWMPLPEPPKD